MGTIDLISLYTTILCPLPGMRYKEMEVEYEDYGQLDIVHTAVNFNTHISYTCNMCRHAELKRFSPHAEETRGTNTTALVICGLLLAICAVMVYRCLARRRMGSPIIGYTEKGRGNDHSARQESTGSDTMSGYGVHGSVMRRK